MAGLFSGGPAPAAIHKASQAENPGEGGGRWYFSRKEIEEISPSRRDGIDLKKEACLRKSYCRFLRVLGMRLKVPQVTIATSIIFCHRFFLRQSHAQNDWRIIATVCMFLAGKVEETPRPLKDVVLVSYEIIHKKDPAAKQRIRQKEMYEQQKELILLGERVVLATLGFDLNLRHPYKPLVDAMKKFKVDQVYLAQVAWNFVNDGLRTSLWLQFMPHHIAAGAIFLAAKFLKVKLPSDGERVWWQEFDITPRQLEEVSNQMLELYERNPAPEAEGSVVDPSSSHGASTSKAASSSEALSKQNPDQTHAENHSGPSRITQTRVGSGNSEINSTRRDNDGHKKSRSEIGDHNEDDREISAAGNEMRYNNSELMKDGHQVRNLLNKDPILGQSPQDANKNLDREKLKAAFEQRRKAVGDRSGTKVDSMDELERELEDVEVTGPSGRIVNPERQQNWPRSSNNKEHENPHSKHASDSVDGNCLVMEWQSSHGDDFDTVEEGELGPFDDAEKGYKSPKSSSRKRKLGDYQEDRIGFARHGYSDRDYKRQQLQENRVLKW